MLTRLLVSVLLLSPVLSTAALARRDVLRAVDRIDREDDTLMWGGLRLGMNVTEVEKVLGAPLPVPEVPRTDLGCPADYGTTVRHKGMSLGLGFDGPGRRGHLREITLILPGPARDDLVIAVKDRFPGLSYVPTRESPDLLEPDDPEPSFRTSFGDLVHVDPGVGVSFGLLCGVDLAPDLARTRPRSRVH